jgi:TRAP-type C4-dicarboxylate transport system permease small subunit
LKKILNHLCGALCAAALFSIMALTFFDVIGRKAVSQSIPGAFEVTEMLMVLVIFAALPLVSERGEHVVFDSLDSFFPDWFIKLQKAFIHLVCGAAMLALAYLMWRTGNQFAQNGDQSAQLHIAKAPFIYGMSIFCGVTGLIHLVLMVKPNAPLAEGEGAAL